MLGCVPNRRIDRGEVVSGRRGHADGDYRRDAGDEANPQAAASAPAAHTSQRVIGSPAGGLTAPTQTGGRDRERH